MNFGPTNAPPFYTAMMNNFKDELDTLFLQCVSKLKKLNVTPVSVISSLEIVLGSNTVVH